MGLRDILQEAVPPAFINSARLKELFSRSQALCRAGNRAPNMSTLAFHLLALIEARPRRNKK